MTSNSYIYRLKVPDTAIDELNHVNNIMYLQWCLDAAEKHWISKTDELFRKKYIWVVLDHWISYKSPAFEGDEIEVLTWVAGNKGVRSERHYKLVRVADQKVLVEAKTTWCLLNGETLRPSNISEEISNLFL